MLGQLFKRNFNHTYVFAIVALADINRYATIQNTQQFTVAEGSRFNKLLDDGLAFSKKTVAGIIKGIFHTMHLSEWR